MTYTAETQTIIDARALRLIHIAEGKVESRFGDKASRLVSHELLLSLIKAEVFGILAAQDEDVSDETVVALLRSADNQLCAR